TGKHKRQTLSQEEMIGRYISHVPARHFKMVRYFGFLANRKRGSVLPKVYEALEMMLRKSRRSRGLRCYEGLPGTDPYQCILCGERLRFAGARQERRRWHDCRKGCVEWRKSDGADD
ncbi:hypothetical protein EWM60_02570, partial [Candidatus Erwinia dacicola]|nr:hypothetical protein [Candidatus Erwinia dacicola]